MSSNIVPSSGGTPCRWLFERININTRLIRSFHEMNVVATIVNLFNYTPIGGCSKSSYHRFATFETNKLQPFSFNYVNLAVVGTRWYVGPKRGRHENRFRSRLIEFCIVQRRGRIGPPFWMTTSARQPSGGWRIG